MKNFDLSVVEIFWSDTTNLVNVLHQADAEKWFIYLTVTLNITLKFVVLFIIFMALSWWLKPSKARELEAQTKLLKMQAKQHKPKKGGSKNV